MNERIKELMLQAFQEHYGDPVTPGAREKALELVSGWGDKFAETIVRQCADAADMAHDARCMHPGDYVGEQLGYGEEHGITEWRCGVKE